MGRDAAAVWLAEDGVPKCAPLPCSNMVPFGRCGGAREAGNTVGEEPGRALLDGYAPDSAKAEGSSIVDEPGEC